MNASRDFSHNSPQTAPVFDLTSLIRPNIRTLKPYASARSEFSGAAEIFLDANENPFGSPRSPRAAATSAAASVASGVDYNRYPDPLQKKVKSRLAAIKSVRNDQIFLGNGSDEVIDLLMRAFCEPAQDSILITPPSYGMYEVSADTNNVRVLRAALQLEGGAYSLDTERILSIANAPARESAQAGGGRTKLIFLCNPGNPTGNCFSESALHEIVQGFDGIVVVDEAYIDFAPERSFVRHLERYPNLVVLQTLSKAWGLAGLRLGMMFAAPAIVRLLTSIKPPYNINAVTQELALQALEHEAWMHKAVAITFSERKRLQAALPLLSAVEYVHPSDASFLLVRCREPRAAYDALIRAGIVVRDRSSVPLCEGCLRVSIGTPDENTRLLAALSAL
jgi:histidinol-phosphate aminotransferase